MATIIVARILCQRSESQITYCPGNLKITNYANYNLVQQSPFFLWFSVMLAALLFHRFTFHHQLQLECVVSVYEWVLLSNRLLWILWRDTVYLTTEFYFKSSDEHHWIKSHGSRLINSTLFWYSPVGFHCNDDISVEMNFAYNFSFCCHILFYWGFISIAKHKIADVNLFSFPGGSDMDKHYVPRFIIFFAFLLDVDCSSQFTLVPSLLLKFVSFHV